jgi:hypothetical protein
VSKHGRQQIEETFARDRAAAQDRREHGRWTPPS